MSSPAARRVVVGVGLAVVFGIGVSMIVAPALRGVKNQAALNAPRAAASSGEPAVNSPAADSAASAREASTAPVAPPAVTTPGPQPSSPPLATNSAASNDTNAPQPRHESGRATQSATGVKKSSAPPNDDTDTTTPSSPPAPNDVVASSDATPAPAPAPDEANANAADTDGRITAQVRSSIATLAPGSNIDVKAMSGIVALAGSVPSQDMVEQARQAAQQVPGVRQVDTSALLVANR
jgi:hyperosmotically inducible protein